MFLAAYISLSRDASLSEVFLPCDCMPPQSLLQWIWHPNQISDKHSPIQAGSSFLRTLFKTDTVFRLWKAQVNNAVWELYSPEGGNFDAEIIFFHGLHVGDDFEEAYWKAWLSTDETVIWPREWLTRKCESARMLSVSYNSSAMKKDRNSPLQMHNLGENLVNDIIYDARCGQAPWRPVILVGHCLGGIVIKQFIISAINMKNLKAKGSKDYIRIENFLNNFKGAFFYATPNGGSPAIEEWGKRLRNPSPLLELFQTLSIRTQRINEEFRQHRRNLDADTYAVAETHETNSLVSRAHTFPIDFLSQFPTLKHQIKNSVSPSILEIYNFFNSILSISG